MSQFKLALGVGGVPPHESAVAYRWEHRLRWLMTAYVASVFVGEDEKRLRSEMHRDILELRTDVAQMVDDEERAIRRELQQGIRELKDEIAGLRTELRCALEAREERR